MALQSEISPRLVGDANKDTKIDGDTKSDGNCSSSTDDVDLEEGEILDSGDEEEEKKDFTNSSLKEALDKSCLQSIQQLVNLAQKADAPKSMASPNSNASPRKMPKAAEGEWFPPKNFSERPFDYKKELAAYRGTPPGSPDRKHMREEKLHKKRLSKKSKSKKAIKRKDIKGQRVTKHKKDPNGRQQICRFFKEGKCAKGSECTYSHASPPGFKKKELCKFYLNGHCNKGKECLYMHNEFPCKFYHTGSECYAKEDCKFSHAPLSDEMRRVLADYLHLPYSEMDAHITDPRNPKRPLSPEECEAPLPSKRPSLLGPPPRHIREAEETRRWQEEMRAQLMNHPGFEIRILHEESEQEFDDDPENHHFFPEDHPPMASPRHIPLGPPMASPQRIPLGMEPPNFVDFSRMSPPPLFQGHPFQQPPPNEEFHYAEDYDDMADEEQDPEDFGWKNSVAEFPEAKEESPKPLVEPDFTSDVQFEETTQFSEMESSADAPEDPSPIVVPSHLPRKQRELFMRIQQHQRKNQEEGSPGRRDLEEEEEEARRKAEAEERWYSSEEEEDDARPLTDLLKKMNQQPPPAKKPETEMTKKPTNKLLEMLSKLQHNPQEKSMAPPTAFWEEILSGTVAPPPTLAPSQGPTPGMEPKRRTLLPNPQGGAAKVEAVSVPNDPRLKNRDPRKLASIANVPKAKEENEIAPPPKIEPPKESNIPYRLHGIQATPPNYTPYIHASQSNPNLLKDPRLRKHLAPPIAPPPSDAPPIPKLLLKYEKTEGIIDIFEPTPAARDDVEAVHVPVSVDPRARRRSQTGSDTPPRLMIVESLESPTTEAAVDEKKWLPPVLEASWAPPPILEQHWTIAIQKETENGPEPQKSEVREKEVVEEELHSDDASAGPPTISKTGPSLVASHLPKAIADPRMAKLHSFLDPRRSRAQTSEAKVSPKTGSFPKDSPTHKEEEPETPEEPDVKAKPKSIPKKRRLSDKSEEKKRTVHRNRKSSMDYASPLNDACNQPQSLGYNSYNKPRPKRTNPAPETETPPPVSEFDPSTLDCDTDVNLKDMFKTIDPTASPFC